MSLDYVEPTINAVGDVESLVAFSPSLMVLPAHGYSGASGNRIVRGVRDTAYEMWLKGDPILDPASARGYMLLRATAKLRRLSTLATGWDGSRGVPPSGIAIRSMGWLLHGLISDGYPTPQLAPDSDGSIQCEWLVNGRSVVLDVSSEGEASLWITEADGHILWEAEFPATRPDPVALRTARGFLEEMGRQVRHRASLR